MPGSNPAPASAKQAVRINDIRPKTSLAQQHFPNTIPPRRLPPPPDPFPPLEITLWRPTMVASLAATSSCIRLSLDLTPSYTDSDEAVKASQLQAVSFRKCPRSEYDSFPNTLPALQLITAFGRCYLRGRPPPPRQAERLPPRKSDAAAEGQGLRRRCGCCARRPRCRRPPTPPSKALAALWPGATGPGSAKTLAAAAGRRLPPPRHVPHSPSHVAAGQDASCCCVCGTMQARRCTRSSPGCRGRAAAARTRARHRA